MKLFSTVLISIVLTMGCARKDTGTNEIPVGTVGTLSAEGLDQVPVCTNRTVLVQVKAIKSALEGHLKTAGEILADGRAYPVPSGTRVQVVEIDRDSKAIRIKMVEGDYEGETGWILEGWFVR
jgi:hypothetical protein